MGEWSGIEEASEGQPGEELPVGIVAQFMECTPSQSRAH